MSLLMWQDFPFESIGAGTGETPAPPIYDARL
jgi:hypothetical protein